MKKIVSNKQEVLGAFHNGCRMIDDHNGMVIQPERIEALVELGRGRRLCLVLNGAVYQSLNGVYLDPSDNTLHLSGYSEGGTIRGDIASPDAIKQYNESVLFDSIKIKKIYYRDREQLV